MLPKDRKGWEEEKIGAGLNRQPRRETRASTGPAIPGETFEPSKALRKAPADMKMEREAQKLGGFAGKMDTLPLDRE